MLTKLFTGLLAATTFHCAHGQSCDAPPPPPPGQAGILNLRVKIDQIFDVQWSMSGGTLSAFSFAYIYASVNYGTQADSAARWTAANTADAGSNGRYIAFFDSTTVAGTYGMAVFNSDGTQYKLVHHTGTFRALAGGAIFYNGNNQWGTLITTEAGYSLGSSGTWPVQTENPSGAELAAYQPPAYSAALQNPPCGVGATCTENSASSYTCTCDTGYSGTTTTDQQASCVNADGCTGVNCGTGATCSDVAAPATGYTCTCGNGYGGDTTDTPCVDADGCSGVDCGTGATCSDVAAPDTGYRCVCDSQYEGSATINERAECSEPGNVAFVMIIVCVSVVSLVLIATIVRRSSARKNGHSNTPMGEDDKNLAVLAVAVEEPKDINQP